MYALALNTLETRFLSPDYSPTLKETGDFLATYTESELTNLLHLHPITSNYPSAHVVKVFLRYTIIELEKSTGKVGEHIKDFSDKYMAEQWKSTYRWENNNYKTLEIKEQYIPF